MFVRACRDRRGVAIVEFALVLPVLAVLLFGLLGYGQYFLLAHSAQQLANDAARATVAGISAGERVALAEATLARELATLPDIKRETVAIAVEEAGEMVSVRVRIDARALPLFRNVIVPMPEATIVRRAVVRQGGIA